MDFDDFFENTGLVYFLVLTRVILILTIVFVPALAEGQEYQDLGDFLKMSETDFKQLCHKKGIAGTFQTKISGSPHKLYGYFNDFSIIPADSGYEITWSKKFYSGKALYLEIKQLVPLKSKDSVYRFFLYGHQRIKDLPSFLSTDGQAFFELSISVADSSSNRTSAACNIHISISYWIYTPPTKLELIRKWRRTQKKFIKNPNYPDPVEAELVQKFQKFFRYLEKHI